MPPEIKDLDLIDKIDVEIEKVTQDELNERDENTPVYKEQLDYDETTVDRLKDEIIKAFKRRQDERDNENLESKWDGLEAQYAGTMEDDANLEFNLNVPVTQVKVDSLVRLSLKAFLESDPKFSVTARPQMAKEDQWDVTITRQSDYLDYKLDEEIDIESPLRKALHQATLLDVGIIKVPYKYELRKRRREESFSGEIIEDEQGNKTQPGVVSFLKQYPEAIEPGDAGHWVLTDLLKEKDVTFKSDFMEPVYDDPMPTFVDIRDLFVPPNTEGYQGLCDTKLIIERQEYSWWELKKAEKNGDLENVDQCKAIKIDSSKKDDKDENIDDGDFRTRNYDVLECTYHFNEKGSEDIDDEVKIKCWFEVRSQAYLGAILYPYDAVESEYIPCYVKNKKAGFYKGGLAEDLTDSHLTQNAVLNFMLTESWQDLMTTPIVREGSVIADQFTSKRWKPGVPLTIPRASLSLTDELGFLDKKQKAVAVQLMPVLMFLAKYDDDRTGISSLATGKESPTDPTAPAAKTAMLLQQSGINISDYINCLLPSFNLIGEIILQLTYQMSKEGRPFKQKQMANKVAGGDPFATISRDEMVAKTNIQSRAAGFAFDKVNEKRELLAFWQMMRADPVFAKNPEGVYALARTLTKAWSPILKNKIDQILTDPQTFSQQQFKVAVQALGVYMQGLQKQAQVTGGQAEPQFQEFMAMATKMMAEAVTPAEEEKK